MAINPGMLTPMMGLDNDLPLSLAAVALTNNLKRQTDKLEIFRTLLQTHKTLAIVQKLQTCLSLWGVLKSAVLRC